MKYLKTYEANTDKIQSIVDKLMKNPDWELLINLLRRNFIKKEDVIPYLKGEDNGLLILNLLQDDFFNKKELKELVGDSKITGDLGDYAKLKLWLDGFMTDEQISKHFSDLHYENGNIYLLASESDLEPYFDKSMIDCVFGDISDWWYSGDYYDMETTDYMWRDLNKENMEEIIKYIVGKKIDYDYYRTPKEHHFWDLEAKPEYFQWLEKDKEYKFIYSGYTYEINTILDENKKGDLSRLYNVLSIAMDRAQESANQDEYYKYAKKAIIQRFTDWKFIMVGKYEYLAFPAHDVNWDPVMDGLEDGYKSYGVVDFTEEYYGDIWSMFKDFNDEGRESFPDYDLYGDIDETLLNEFVSEDLDWNKNDLK